MTRAQLIFLRSFSGSDEIAQRLMRGVRHQPPLAWHAEPEHCSTGPKYDHDDGDFIRQAEAHAAGHN
jgi:hypothetical protein